MAKPTVRTLQMALRELCGTAKTQSGEHIKPLHYHLSERLVLEGGFPPEWLAPRPPFSSGAKSHTDYTLNFSPADENAAEQHVLGGIKPKRMDLTVLVPGIGPALGISAKSTGNAFRNLSNRMEEALGDCANVHMMYPGFVFGFLHCIRFATVSEGAKANDATFDDQLRPLHFLVRYHDVLVSLSGRATITDPAMRYESVGLLVYRLRQGNPEVFAGYPPDDSPVHYGRFFQRLYDLYDLRFAYPDGSGRNHRKVWSLASPDMPQSFDSPTGFGWSVRTAAEDAEPSV